MKERNKVKEKNIDGQNDDQDDQDDQDERWAMNYHLEEQTKKWWARFVLSFCIFHSSLV